jgi:glycosyltransferase involved in cell wall biosynthesis
MQPTDATDTTDVGNVDVSVLIPVLNEERYIRETAATMCAQELDGTFELLFADGRSDDRTREILEQLAAEDPRIRVLDNPDRRTASGLNVCLREARGEFVARMDAHTYYAPDYLATGVDYLRSHDVAWVSGPAIPRPVGEISRAVALGLSSPLGRGGSKKWESTHQRGAARDLDTGVFGGVWRRSAVLAIGGWDERWPVNQDSEMAARFLTRGDRIVCLDEMAGHYVPRDTVARLARQYWRYGFYRARTFRRHPSSMRRSHLVAPALATTAAAAVVSPRSVRRPARLAMGLYASAIVATALRCAIGRCATRTAMLLTVVLPTMHLSWGAGTLVGAARFGPPVAALFALARARRPAKSREDRVHAPALHATRAPHNGAPDRGQPLKRSERAFAAATGTGRG